MKIKNCTTSDVFLSGRAHRTCKKILEVTSHKATGRSFAELVNRIVVDYTNESEENTDHRFLRLYYLYLSLKDSMVWDRGISTQVPFREPAMLFMRGLQEFASKRKVSIKIPDIPNVIIHDHIAFVELKGIAFEEHYLSKHLIITTTI